MTGRPMVRELSLASIAGALSLFLAADGLAAQRLDDARLRKADAEPGQWLSIGRTTDEQRFSPLAKITTGNVSQLGLAWFADFETNRGQEASPLVIDGVLYVTTAWSKLYAFDAKTGKR